MVRFLLVLLQIFLDLEYTWNRISYPVADGV